MSTSTIATARPATEHEFRALISELLDLWAYKAPPCPETADDEPETPEGNGRWQRLKARALELEIMSRIRACGDGGNYYGPAILIDGRLWIIAADGNSSYGEDSLTYRELVSFAASA